MKNLALALAVFFAAQLASAQMNKNKISTEELQLADDITMNMRFTLAPMMFSQSNRELGYAADFAISDNFMVGPQLSYFKYSGKYSNVSYFGIGVSSTYSLTENFSNSWFVSSGLKVYTKSSAAYANASSVNAGVDIPEQNVNASLMYGYKWFFADGFNIRLSAGLQYNSNDNLIESMYTDEGYFESVSSMRGSQINFDSDLSVGLVF